MRQLFTRLLADKSGVVAPIIALSFAAVVAAAGAATDYARAQMVQTKLADTLDAAGLAAGATMSSQDAKDGALNYFRVNFPSSYMDSNATLNSVTADSTNTVLTLHATATVPTVFMKIMGIDSVTVTADSEITRKAGGLELALVMDNTGSMAGDKITNLKSSATQLVNILFGQDATKDDLWIGLVPFSQAVNIGPAHTSWLSSNPTTLDWAPSGSWAGCVDADYTSNEDNTDDPLTTRKFAPYYWASDSNNQWKTVTTKKKNGVTTTTTTYANNIGPDLGPNAYCPQPLQIMSNAKATVLKGINTMQARGNTHINLGAAWGWRMLSPRWRGAWGGAMDTNSLPLDYSTPNMTKAVVILTDGDNTMSNSVRSAYGYLSEGHLGTTNATTSVTKLNTKLSTVCTSMKSHGIKVYTILFDVSSKDTTAINLMKNCASEDDYFFNTPTSAELSKAFQQIGDSLSNLRISK